MDRAEALKAKRKAHEEMRRQDAEALRARDQAEANRTLEQTAKLFVCLDGFFLNKGKVAELAGPGHGEFPLSGESRKMGAWSFFPGWECYSAQSVVDLFNSGALGTHCMGKLELVPIRTLADLDGAPGRLLHYVSPLAAKRGMAVSNGTVPIDKHFAVARGHCIHKTSGDTLAGPQGVVGEHAWAAIDGDRRRGAVASIREAVPFEALVAYGFGDEDAPSTILAVRSLKYQASTASDPAAAAPFVLVMDLAKGEFLLKPQQVWCSEKFRPRLADLPPVRLTVDPLGAVPFRIEAMPELELSTLREMEGIEADMADQDDDEEATAEALADQAARFLEEHADDPGVGPDDDDEELADEELADEEQDGD